MLKAASLKSSPRLATAPRARGVGPAAVDRDEQSARLAGAGALVLLCLFLGFTFVGTTPFAVADAADRADGSLIDRVVVLVLFVLAAAILALVHRRALDLAKRNWVLLLLLAWCVASIAWADFPGLALRRTALLIMLSIIAYAIALGLTRSSRFVQVALPLLGCLVVFNLATPYLHPEFAVTPIGLRGIYSQKNVAGMVAMVAIVMAYAVAVADPRRRSLMLAGAVFVVAVAFLVLTQSKTSAGMVALVVLVVGPVLIAWQIGVIWGLLATVAVGYGLGAFLMVVFANSWTLAEVLDVVVGDPTFTGRTDIWAFAWNEIGARPWLGSGYGAFWDVGAAADPLQRAPFGSWLRDVEVGVINQAHSGYLDLPLQIGVPATVLATAVVLRAWWLAWGLAVRAPLHSNARIIGVFGFMFCAVFLAHNFMEATLFNRGQMLCNVSLLVFFLLEREAADAAAPTPATARAARRSSPSAAFGRRLQEHRRRRPGGPATAITPNGGRNV